MGDLAAADLEVQMRPGRTPGRADLGDLLTLLDEIALLDEELRAWA